MMVTVLLLHGENGRMGSRQLGAGEAEATNQAVIKRVAQKTMVALWRQLCSFRSGWAEARLILFRLYGA